MSLTSSSFNYQISPMSAPKKIAIKDNGEVILLKEGHVEITDLSAVIGQRTYTIANIHSVHVHAYRTKLFLSMFFVLRSEEHTSELQSQSNLVCRLLLEKKKY